KRDSLTRRFLRQEPLQFTRIITGSRFVPYQPDIKIHRFHTVRTPPFAEKITLLRQLHHLRQRIHHRESAPGCHSRTLPTRSPYREAALDTLPRLALPQNLHREFAWASLMVLLSASAA